VDDLDNNLLNKEKVSLKTLSPYLALSLVGSVLVAFAASLEFPLGLIAFVGLAGAIIGGILVAVYPQTVILFLVVYMPLESFIIKFTPGPEQVYLAAQLGSEALVYALFAVVLLKRILAGKPIRHTPIDFLLILFAAGAVLSILLNGASPWASLSNLRPMLRFVLLYYVVINLDFSEAQVNNLLWAILIGGAIQILLGVVQRLGGAPVKALFIPRASTLDLLGKSRNFVLLTSGRELGSVFGTLGDTLHFGIFISIVLIVYLSRIKNLTWVNLLVISALMGGVALSYARGVFFAALVIIVIWYAVFYRPVYIPILAGTGLALLIVIGGLVLYGSTAATEQYYNPRQTETTAARNLLSIFSQSYLERARNQRLGAVIFVPPVVLREKPVFGYGPDTLLAIEKLSETELPVVYRALKESIFEDVYWVALLTYYGSFGLFTFIGIFLAVAVTAWKKHLDRAASPTSRALGRMAFLMVVNAVFILFFYRALEFRVFGFYLWFLAGIAISDTFTRRQENLNLEKRQVPVSD
jgi:hypothetical protein